MASKVSAGLLMFRQVEDRLEVFLAHPGGPYFASKDEGVWTIPKGLPNPGEPLEQTAIREFGEETQQTVREPLIPLGNVVQRGGKEVHAWAFRGDLEDGRPAKSNTFQLEWPPRSGRIQSFPEIDRVEFFSIDEARAKVNPAQVAFLDRLAEHLAGSEGG